MQSSADHYGVVRAIWCEATVFFNLKIRLQVQMILVKSNEMAIESTVSNISGGCRQASVAFGGGSNTATICKAMTIYLTSAIPLCIENMRADDKSTDFRAEQFASL